MTIVRMALVAVCSFGSGAGIAACGTLAQDVKTGETVGLAVGDVACLVQHASEGPEAAAKDCGLTAPAQAPAVQIVVQPGGMCQVVRAPRAGEGGGQ
jgi:hypothetical protein